VLAYIYQSTISSFLMGGSLVPGGAIKIPEPGANGDSHSGWTAIH